MCGICGIVAGAGGGSPDSAAVGRMTDALAHRGPDGAGQLAFADAILGHRRLSIIDPEHGHQPMTTPDGAVALTFNGEIYGYRDLMHEVSGYPFRTACDTELLLAMYLRDGTDLLEKLPGMFAFAMWDDRNRLLFAARDRFGEKPFYYAWGRGGEFVFASELKGILASGLLEPRIDPLSLRHFLQKAYVPPDRTIFENVHVLPPAHALELRRGELRIWRYWSPPEATSTLSLEDSADVFRDLFARAVRNQLVADVPVTAFLSGGLDSTSVVMQAAQFAPHIRPLSFRFSHGPDETPFAREVASKAGLQLIELHDRGEDMADLVRTMASVYDEPFADSSNIPTYLISREARRHAKVVLTGDGADELLGGYDFWYRSLWNVENETSIVAYSRIISLAAVLAARSGLPLPHRVRRFAEASRLMQRYRTPLQAHVLRNPHFTHEEVLELCRGIELDPPSARGGDLDAVLRHDLSHYMPGDILVKTDRASMAHGLELRAPFLDVELASFCLSAPLSMKISESEEKVLLRRAFEKTWPATVARRAKHGFGGPVNAWLREPNVDALVRETFHPRARIYDLLDRDSVEPFLTARDYRTWILLTLALWAERWYRT